MSVHFSSDWWDWAEEALIKGCTIESMIEAMVKSGFDLEQAKSHIQEVKEKKITKLDRFPHLKNLDSAYDSSSPLSFIKNTNTIELPDRLVDIAFRVTKPDVVYIDNFLSYQECDLLVEQSKSQLTPSTVVNYENNSGKIHQARTSEGMCFRRYETDLISSIERRIAALINMPVSHGEGIQILHYKVGAEYQPHYDYFPPDNPGSQIYTDVGGQRVCSFIMYLNDVEDGGYTVLPKINLSVLPKKGSALYFSYLNSKGQVDSQTFHGGAPVIKGEKWIATKWLREREYTRV
jgi:prolyl 4-hydroxylase